MNKYILILLLFCSSIQAETFRDKNGKYLGQSRTFQKQTFYYNSRGQSLGSLSNGSVRDNKGRYLGSTKKEGYRYFYYR